MRRAKQLRLLSCLHSRLHSLHPQRSIHKKEYQYREHDRPNSSSLHARALYRVLARTLTKRGPVEKMRTGAVGILGGGVGAGREEHLDGFVKPAVRRIVQRRHRVGAARQVGVGARLDEGPRGGRVPHSHRLEQCGRSVRLCLVRVGARREQELKHLDAVLDGRGRERLGGEPLVGIGASCQQSLHHGRVARHRRLQQGGGAVALLRGVGVGARCKERLHHCDAVLEGGRVQGRHALLDRRRRDAGIEQALHKASMAHARGDVQGHATNVLGGIDVAVTGGLEQILAPRDRREHAHSRRGAPEARCAGSAMRRKDDEGAGGDQEQQGEQAAVRHRRRRREARWRVGRESAPIAVQV
eukprot:scaffold47308_cov61-Phaeocystis_antarctica.AAC.5